MRPASRHTLMFVTPTKGIGPHSCVAAIPKNAIHGLFTHLFMDRGSQTVGVSASLGVWVSVGIRGVWFPVPAAHARARHVDDEGTYVRIKRRISYDA